MIKQDKLYYLDEEINHLEFLLKSAYLKKREMLKIRKKQGWWDWLLEIVGY